MMSPRAKINQKPPLISNHTPARLKLIVATASIIQYNVSFIYKLPKGPFPCNWSRSHQVYKNNPV